MDLWLTLGVSPVVGIGAAFTGLVCAAAFALMRLRRKARAKTFDLGLQSVR